MRILVVNYEYPPLGGGGGVATKQTAEELAKKHEVHVLTSSHEGVYKDELVNRVHIHHVPVSGRSSLPTATLQSMLTFLPRAFWRGQRLCRETNFDVMNAQFVLPSGLPAAVLAKLFRIPFVVSFIGGDVYDPTKAISPHRHWYLRLLVRVISQQAKICTAISEDTKRRAQTLHGVKREIVVTHLGYTAAPGVPDKSRQELDLPDLRAAGVSIGRLIPRKGYERLIRAWKDVPDAVLTIIGEGPLRDKLHGLVSQLGLRDRIRLVGFVSEARKIQLLRASDVYVSAAEHEGFGLVFLEAMDAGLPIVAMGEGGHTDFLKEGKNVLFVPENKLESLAVTVKKLLADEQLMKEMGERNREYVEEFTVERVTKRFEDVLVKATKQ